jgi:hypothetical protein
LKPGFHSIGSRVGSPGSFKLWGSTGFANLHHPTAPGSCANGRNPPGSRVGTKVGTTVGTRVGTFHVILQSKYIQLMSDSSQLVHVTSLTPGSSCNPTWHHQIARVGQPLLVDVGPDVHLLVERGVDAPLQPAAGAAPPRCSAAGCVLERQILKPVFSLYRF